MFGYLIARNLLLRLPLKEFWKSTSKVIEPKI